MPFLPLLFVIGASYVIGAIPWGIVVVFIFTGKDIRKMGSGRTGGTNVMRAAGLLAGASTAILDVMKGVASGWIADALVPGNVWVKVLAAVIALLASTKSIFYTERDAQGKLQLKGRRGRGDRIGGGDCFVALQCVFHFSDRRIGFCAGGLCLSDHDQRGGGIDHSFRGQGGRRGRSLAVYRIWGVSPADCAVCAAPQPEATA